MGRGGGVGKTGGAVDGQPSPQLNVAALSDRPGRPQQTSTSTADRSSIHAERRVELLPLLPLLQLCIIIIYFIFINAQGRVFHTAVWPAPRCVAHPRPTRSSDVDADQLAIAAWPGESLVETCALRAASGGPRRSTCCQWQ